MKKKIIIGEQELTIERAFELFLLEQEEKVKNGEIVKVTYESYKVLIRYFIDFVSPDCLCKNIDTNMLIKYRDYQLGRISSITTRTYVKHTYVFLHYCMSLERKWIPYFEPIHVKAQKKKKIPLTQDELKRMLKRPNLKTTKFSEFRSWIALMLFASTAMRLASAWELKICDIDFKNNIIHIRHNKSKVPYDTYMSEELKNALTLYLKYRGGEPNDYLFCCEDYSRLTKDGFKQAITRYQKKVGARTGTHIFRHTLATTLAKNGKGAFIQVALGHSSDAMAKEYISFSHEDISDVLELYSPLSSITQKKDRIKMN